MNHAMAILDTVLNALSELMPMVPIKTATFTLGQDENDDFKDIHDFNQTWSEASSEAQAVIDVARMDLETLRTRHGVDIPQDCLELDVFWTAGFVLRERLDGKRIIKCYKYGATQELLKRIIRKLITVYEKLEAAE